MEIRFIKNTIKLVKINKNLAILRDLAEVFFGFFKRVIIGI